LNDWLTSNAGYVNGDDLIWNTVHKLGSIVMTSYVTSLSQAQIKAHIQACNPIVVNVRGGEHWVLITGWDDANANTFYVNDPGFTNTFYDYTGMLRFVVYSY